jgi:hypothetical protein
MNSPPVSNNLIFAHKCNHLVHITNMRLVEIIVEVHLIPTEDLENNQRHVLCKTDAISWTCRLQDDNSAAITYEFCATVSVNHISSGRRGKPRNRSDPETNQEYHNLLITLSNDTKFTDSKQQLLVTAKIIQNKQFLSSNYWPDILYVAQWLIQ